MSVFYGVRLSDALSQKIEATGRGKSEVISAAVEAYFNVKATVEQKQPAAERKPAARATKAKLVIPRGSANPTIVVPDPLAEALELAASGIDVVAVVSEEPSGCAKHPGGGGWPKAGDWWCPQCGKIV